MRFSIVVPAYNEAAYLGATLTSMQAQDFPGPYEIIVVDNDSSDDTGTVAASYGVRVVRESERGVCAARQRGCEAARGEIIVSTDADTIYPPDWLSTIDGAFASEHTVAVAGPCRYEHSRRWIRVLPGLLFALVAAIYRLTGLVSYVSATNLAMRRTAFPGYDTTLTQGGDELDVLRRLRPQGRVVWLRENAVVTSPRRLNRGFVYSIVVSLFVHYLLAYAVNRLTGRQAFGMAPAFRRSRRTPVGPRLGVRIALGLALLAVTAGLVTVVGPAATGSIAVLWSQR
ncbi:MAG TPA: glycosyltransferase family A protein [Propionibacteriaceae bacterium]